jgi:hypothetical protein
MQCFLSLGQWLFTFKNWKIAREMPSLLKKIGLITEEVNEDRGMKGKYRCIEKTGVVLIALLYGLLLGCGLL